MLNKRLKAITELIEPCEVLMDVGSDHGFLPLYLLLNKKIKHAIIGEINQGPLEQAKKNFRDYANLSVSYLLSDGLKQNNQKLDAVVIAGMGYETIEHIILQDIEQFKSISQILIQSNTKNDQLKQFLNDNHFSIIDESIVKDRKYFYPVIKVKYDQNKQLLNKSEILFGPILIQKNTDIFKDYLLFQKGIEEKILVAQKKESSEKILMINKLLGL